MGNGGKGYFVLDVSKPAQFASSPPSSLVVLDGTDPATMDPDIGHISSDPVPEMDRPAVSRQITQLNDGR